MVYVGHARCALEKNVYFAFAEWSVINVSSSFRYFTGLTGFLSTFLLINEQGVLMFPTVIVDLFIFLPSCIRVCFIYFVFT